MVEKIEALAEGNNLKTLAINVLEDKMTATRILQLCNKMGVDLKQIVDKEVTFYKENLVGKNYDEADWVRILVKHPEVIKIPIVETDKEAKIVENPRAIFELASIKQNINGYDHLNNHNK